MKRMLIRWMSMGALVVAFLMAAAFAMPGTARATAEGALANGPFTEGGTLAPAGATAGTVPLAFEGTPVTLPSNPAQTPASFALAQSAIVCYSTAQTPGAVNANTSAEQAFTVTGILAGSLTVASKPTTQAGLLLNQMRVSAASTVQASYSNVTAGNLTPTAESYLVVEIRGPLIQTQAATFASAVPTLTTLEFAIACTPAAGQQGLSTAQHAGLTAAGLPVVPQASVAVATPVLPFTVPSTIGSATPVPATQAAATPYLSGTPQTVIVNKPTGQAGLGAFNWRIGANNQLNGTFVNTSGAGITPTNETYSFFACRGMSLHGPVAYLVNVGTLAAVAQGTSAVQTVTCNGLAATDRILSWLKPTEQAGLILAKARISSANTISLEFGNIPNAGGNLTPTASEIYVFYVDKGPANSVGSILQQFTVSFSPVAVAAITSAEQIFAVPNAQGIQLASASFFGGINLMSGAAFNGATGSLGGPLVQGLVCGGFRASSAGNLALNLGNVTAAQLTAAQIGTLMATFLAAPTGISGGAASAAGSGVQYGYDVQDQQQQETVTGTQIAAVARSVEKGA